MNSLVYALQVPARSIAIVTALALLAWTMGLPAWINTAEAESLEEVSDTLSVGPSATLGASAPGADAAHRIQFTVPNGISDTGTVVIDFDPTGSLFGFAGFTIGDVDIVAGGTQVANVGACGGPADEMYVTLGGGDDIVLNLCTGHDIASSTSFIVDVGTSTGGNLIANPAVVDDYVIAISGTGNMVDSGDTRVAIVNEVTVTAAVDTIFTFSVNAVPEGATVNDEPETTSTTTTPTAIPFGTIAPGTALVAAQELRVDTNAYNGFSVTVQADQTLTAGNGATIDEFLNGTAVASSTAWAGPAGTMGNTDTYGHWGLTSDDNAVSSTTPGLWGAGHAAYQGNFIDNPVEVFYHGAAVANDAGMGVGSTTVAYKVEIMELQEAAKDYTATLTYIATPVF